jgi:flagellar basal-body rod modification protein FlgD
MTTPVSGPLPGSSSPPATTPTIPATPGTGPTPDPTARSRNSVDKDLFLKLLVAQLKFQDPTRPTDTSQFLSQTAQFTMVEKMEEAAKQQQELITAQLMTSATGMLGKTVTYTGPDGTEATGVVTATTIGSDPHLKVGNTDVALSSVKEVKNSPAAAGTPAK